jgi:hypothetical protein
MISITRGCIFLTYRLDQNTQDFLSLLIFTLKDHLITMTQNLNHYEKILSRSHSNYLAQISIEMTDANNQINDVLSKLTALGTVLIPMNLVTGTQAFLKAATVFDFLNRSVGYERSRTGARYCRKNYLVREIVSL